MKRHAIRIVFRKMERSGAIVFSKRYPNGMT